MSDELKVLDRDGVRWIEIDRPSSRNGLSIDVNAEMIAALEATAAQPEIRVVVITGAGGNFSSGLDLKDAMLRGPQPPEKNQENMRRYFHGLIRAVRALVVPTIAAVDGHAVGFGCDLALACDLRLVSDRARFGEVFVRRGLMPDGGGTYSLPRLVGLGRALELMYTGEIIDAQEAVRIGLANRIIPAAEFETAVWELARRLAKGPPIAFRHIKAAVYASLDSDLEAALEREVVGQMECLGSNDFFEGVAAFLGKRDPSFSGR